MNGLKQQAQEAIEEPVESGAERGLQVAVYGHSDLVVDAGRGRRQTRNRASGRLGYPLLRLLDRQGCDRGRGPDRDRLQPDQRHGRRLACIGHAVEIKR